MHLTCCLPSAMQQVLDNLGSLPNATGAAELDLIFLRGIMESPIVRSLAKVQCAGEWGVARHVADTTPGVTPRLH